MISGLFSRLVILSFGTLYPAYASFKAVRSKDVQEYVKWMMYWIVFAIFTCIETFTDIFLPWFPFYYEIKVVLVLWLLSPATNGSSILYRKFVHPLLKRKEAHIDECIVRVREQGYATLLDLGMKAVNSVSNFVLETVQRNYRATGGAQRAVLSASQSHGSLSGQRAIVDDDQRLPVSRTRSLQTLRNIPAAALLTVEENDEVQQAELELRELQQQLEAHVNTRSSKTVLKKVATTASGKRAKRQ